MLHGILVSKPDISEMICNFLHLFWVLSIYYIISFPILSRQWNDKHTNFFHQCMYIKLLYLIQILYFIHSIYSVKFDAFSNFQTYFFLMCVYIWQIFNSFRNTWRIIVETKSLMLKNVESFNNGIKVIE